MPEIQTYVTVSIPVELAYDEGAVPDKATIERHALENFLYHPAIRGENYGVSRMIEVDLADLEMFATVEFERTPYIPQQSTTITLTDAQRYALGYALDLAADDQNNYLSYGSPEVDYGKEWPEIAKERAEKFIALGRVGELLGFCGEGSRWTDLANEVLETIDEVGYCVDCGSKCVACDDGATVLCPKCDIAANKEDHD